MDWTDHWSGMLSLPTARPVGPKGTVHAIEPNPLDAARIDDLVGLHHIPNLHVHHHAIGGASCDMTLPVLAGISALGTLAPLDDESRGSVTATHRVAVVRGYALFGDLLSGPVVMKIDVQGFECGLLEGFGAMLERLRLLVFAEVEPPWLERAGDAAEQLFGMLGRRGYAGWPSPTA